MAATRKRAASTGAYGMPVKRSCLGKHSYYYDSLDRGSIQYHPPSPHSVPDVYTKSKRSCSLDRSQRPDPSHSEDFKNITKANMPPYIENDPGFDWKDIFEHWPPVVPEDFTDMSSHTKKRSRPTSYAQSVRDGDSPAAWTQQHEENMEQAGLIMTDYQHRATITEDCRQLCNQLLNTKVPLPKDRCFQQDRLAQVLKHIRYRNEARVVRDLLPIVAPSPELLFIDGHIYASSMGEAINAEWTRCDTICGPKPKPDFVVGISQSAFSKEEVDKLKLCHTSACPNLFPENMYFPFLICEVKGDRAIQEAERQAMHSACIATRAVIELYKKVFLTEEIEQKILVFSIAHDKSSIKMFGHFAKVNDYKVEYFRYRLYSGEFSSDLSVNEWTKAYQITRAIYEHFYPQHLARIKHALSKMASFTSQLRVTEDSQGSAAELQDGHFKKPPLPSVTTAKLQREIEKLNKQLLRNTRNHQAEASRQREEQREQLAQQKEESQEQKRILEQQLAQQKEESREQKKESQEQKRMMEQQLAQQKEDSRSQKEEWRSQKEMMEKQLSSNEEIIRLLKGRDKVT